MHLTKYLITHRLASDATLWVNTLSGALDVFDNEELRQIENLVSEASSPDSALARRLTARGYLFASDDDEQREFLALREKLRAVEACEPTVFAVCPTYSCFFKCAYCYEGELTEGGHKALLGAREILAGMEQMEQFLRRELTLPDRPYITFLGGEALQESTRPLVNELLAESSQRGYSIAIITNGFLLDTFLEKLAHFAGSLKYIQITLDGPKEMHDRRRPLAGGGSTFQRVVDNIELALDAGLPVRLRTNLDLENVGGLVDLARLVREKGWSRRANFKAYLAPVEDSTCRDLHVAREDELLRAWLPLKEGAEWGELLQVFDDAKLFRATDMLETTISRAAHKVLPRFSYCAATKGKSFVFGPEGLIYQCLRGVGEVRASIGRFWPAFDVDRSKMQHWLRRDIINIQCASCAPVATLQGGGCALESLIREGNLHACTCGDAPQVISGYLEFRTDKILHQAFAAAPRSGASPAGRRKPPERLSTLGGLR